MKRFNKKIYGFALVVAFAGVVSSCSNELHEPTNPGNDETPGYKLVKEPSITAWTGSQIMTTRGADVNGNLWYQNWDRPTNVTEEEIAKVLEEASKQRVNAKNDIHIDWNNYWVQQVYTGQQTYVDGYGNNIGTGSSHMNHLLAYTDKVKEQTAWYPTPEFTLRDKYSYENVYEHINNFNNGSNNTEYTDDVTGEKFYGTTLMTDMYAEGIIDQFGYHNTTDSKNHYEYIILEIDGSYYICFDFYATHPEGQDANKNMDVERDWVFNDWIVKISPAYHVGETPEKPVTPDTCTKCGHKSHDENCPSCPEDEGCNKDVVIETNDMADGHSEVEINLAINDPENQGDIEHLIAKLSIHVRYAGDVEVFIPAGPETYLHADDLAIFNKHDFIKDGDKFFVYGGPMELSYTFGGNTVTLYINYEVNGIRVTTEGINESVFDYCQRNFKDGINFEIYNYFNLDDFEGSYQAAFEPIKSLLDQATVKFLGNQMPFYYINAFNKTENGEKFGGDCTVSIIEDQATEFNEAQTGNHLNNSNWNEIYKYKSVTDNKGVEHKHEFLWKNND